MHIIKRFKRSSLQCTVSCTPHEGMWTVLLCGVRRYNEVRRGPLSCECEKQQTPSFLISYTIELWMAQCFPTCEHWIKLQVLFVWSLINLWRGPGFKIIFWASWKREDITWKGLYILCATPNCFICFNFIWRLVSYRGHSL